MIAAEMAHALGDARREGPGGVVVVRCTRVGALPSAMATAGAFW